MKNFVISCYIDNELSYNLLIKSSSAKEAVKEHLDRERIDYDNVFGLGSWDLNHKHYTYLVN
jgi:hypothetical protein